MRYERHYVVNSSKSEAPKLPYTRAPKSVLKKIIK